MIDKFVITLEAEDRTVATGQLVSLEEYLHTSYRPDCDYVEGELRERNVGQHDHSRLRFLILLALGRKEEEWQVHTLPEQRLRVGQRRYRIPDILVLDAAAPRTPVIETAPLLCIEILSPDDRMSEMLDRAADYVGMGVPETWIFDPAKRRAYIYGLQGLHEAGQDATLRCGNVEIAPPDIFSKL
jgi:Uma2 family endonuclease